MSWGFIPFFQLNIAIMKYTSLILVLLFIAACRPSSEKNIRIIGEKIIVKKNANGEEYYDTLSARAPQFSFIGHHGVLFGDSNVKNKVWIADFFFTHCPSICVKMKSNLLKTNKKFGQNDNFHIVSFSIDPQRDSVTQLYNYAEKLGVQNTNWTFLTGDKETIYNVADLFLAHAAEDENSPGGFIHDGNFIVVDKQGRIRGFYDGTDDKSVEKMMDDLEILLK